MSCLKTHHCPAIPHSSSSTRRLHPPTPPFASLTQTGCLLKEKEGHLDRCLCTSVPDSFLSNEHHLPAGRPQGGTFGFCCGQNHCGTKRRLKASPSPLAPSSSSGFCQVAFPRCSASPFFWGSHKHPLRNPHLPHLAAGRSRLA